jgi:hypothetical protein
MAVSAIWGQPSIVLMFVAEALVLRDTWQTSAAKLTAFPRCGTAKSCASQWHLDWQAFARTEAD